MKNEPSKARADELVREMRGAYRIAVDNPIIPGSDHWAAVTLIVLRTPELCDLLEQYSSKNETLRAGVSGQSPDIAGLKGRVDKLWELVNETEGGDDE